MKNQLITNRIIVIDALRGFALLGIIVNHCSQEFLTGLMPPSNPTFNIFSPTDAIVGDISTFIENIKNRNFFHHVRIWSGVMALISTSIVVF